MTNRLLFCDQAGPGRDAFSAPLVAHGYVVVTPESVEEARAELLRGEFDAVLVDLHFLGTTALEFLREAERLQPGVDLLLLASYETVETAVAAMREGAADYLTKPFSFPELEARLTRLRAMREQRDELRRLRAILDESGAAGGITVDSPAMREVDDRIHLSARGSLPVLLVGEVGTGKELAARTIHALGRRRARPFVVVVSANVPRLDEALRPADGGTVLFERVDELAVDRQAELVHFLHEGMVRTPDGAGRLVDVRVLATSMVDLGAAVEEGRFHSDLRALFQRNEIHLPPLRQRGDDVLLVAHQFLRVLASREGRGPLSLSAAAAEMLRRHEWPGNIGELQRVIASAVTFGPTTEIDLCDLPKYLARGKELDRPFTLHLEGRPQLCLRDLVHELEQEIVDWALRKAEGQEDRAAEILGVPAATIASSRSRAR